MTTTPDTKKLAEDVNRIFEVSKEINYEDGQVTAVLRDLLTLMSEMREALEFYADKENYLTADEAGEYEEPFKGLMGEPTGVVMTIIDEAGKDCGTRSRAALARIEPLKHLMKAK